jgi:hypothetical protein
LLADGKVLVAGGVISGHLPSAELYDPTTGTWTLIDSFHDYRFAHRATLLPDATVLIAGGSSTGNDSLASAERYDPSTGHWTVTGSMNAGRHDFTATLLADGKVLAVGGWDGSDALASAELYDPGTVSATQAGRSNIEQ